MARGPDRRAAASTEPLALPASAGFAWGVTRRSSRAIGDAVTGDPGAPSDDWVYRLSHAGPDRDAAIAALHALLLRAARFEVNRRGAVFPNLHGADLDDLACQSADDAMMSILRRLADFRGESRFTTWACKFALVEAGAKVRRHAWRGREIPVTAESLSADADNAPLPDAHAEAQMLLIAVREEVKRQLTARQREVFRGGRAQRGADRRRCRSVEYHPRRGLQDVARCAAQAAGGAQRARAGHRR